MKFKSASVFLAIYLDKQHFKYIITCNYLQLKNPYNA